MVLYNSLKSAVRQVRLHLFFRGTELGCVLEIEAIQTRNGLLSLLNHRVLFLTADCSLSAKLAAVSRNA